jgi:TetR/AcrR family transcriptional repressor of nem operon
MARTKDFDEDEVLQKAVCLFWHKGYNGTSMQDLVDGLGISRSSIYDTYGDKHALFIKTLQRYEESVYEKVVEIVNQTAPAKEIIKQLLNFITSELLNDEQHKGCFLVNAAIEVAPHDQEVSDLVCHNDQQVEGFFYEAVKKGQENGEISKQKDARALARFIFNNVKGIRVTAKSTTDKRIFEDIISMTLAALD